MAARPGYVNGGEAEDGGDGNVGQNPTGRPRKSSARKRRQKDNKLFGGTIWGRPPKKPEQS